MMVCLLIVDSHDCQVLRQLLWKIFAVVKCSTIVVVLRFLKLKHENTRHHIEYQALEHEVTLEQMDGLVVCLVAHDEHLLVTQI